CAFARVVRHVTGIDLTPAMLDRARALAAEKGLANITWQHGDVLPLPYPEGSFTIVTARFAFHHFLDPGAVLAEMRRARPPRRPRAGPRHPHVAAGRCSPPAVSRGLVHHRDGALRLPPLPRPGRRARGDAAGMPPRRPRGGHR